MRALLLLPALAACDDLTHAYVTPSCPPTSVEDEAGACHFDEAEVAELVRTFDRGRLVRVNAVPFEQISSAGVMRNVWITPEAEALYRRVDPDREVALPEPFPVGTAIVHERVDRLEGHTVQVKLEDGWWFGKYFDDGTPDEVPCTPCVACHNEDLHPTTEGLWGVPRHAL